MVDVIALGERDGGTALLATHVIEERVAGDPPEPALERSGRVLLETATDPEEDFLGEVVGVVRVAGEPIREVVDLAPIPACNLFPGGYAVALSHRPPPD